MKTLIILTSREILKKVQEAGFTGAVYCTSLGYGEAINVSRQDTSWCQIGYYANHSLDYLDYQILFEENVDVAALADEFIPKPKTEEFTMEELLKIASDTRGCVAKLKETDKLLHVELLNERKIPFYNMSKEARNILWQNEKYVQVLTGSEWVRNDIPKQNWNSSSYRINPAYIDKVI